MPPHGTVREHEGGAERADRGRRPQNAEPGGADLEDVAREHGEQRDRAAEQHGEQVERDRPEQHRRPTDEAHAAEDAREIRGSRACAVAARTHQEHRCERDEREKDATP